jgi:hypothetical protein
MRRLGAVAIIALLVVGAGSAGCLTAARAVAAEDKNVVILEMNGVRLYVPELWVWPNKAVWKKPGGTILDPTPQMLPDDPPGIVYRVDRLIDLELRAFENRAHFPQLKPDFWVYRVDLKPGPRGLAKLPRKTIDDLPAVIRARLGPIDADGFRHTAQRQSVLWRVA